MPKSVDDCYADLGVAIVKGAVEDYKKALINDFKKGISDNERFFRSGWYRVLTNIDGEWLMSQLRDTVRKFRDEANLAFDENRISGMKGKSFLPNSQAFQCPVCGGNVYVVYKRLQFLFETDEKTGSMYRIGESIGHRATCFGCGLTFKREDHAKIYPTPVFHCKPNEKCVGVKGNKFAIKEKRNT